MAKIPFHWYASKFHQEDGKDIIEHVQDVETIVEANKHLRDETSSVKKYPMDQTFHLVARVPAVDAMELHKTTGFLGPEPDHKAIDRALNSREYAHVRTKPGKI